VEEVLGIVAADSLDFLHFRATWVDALGNFGLHIDLLFGGSVFGRGGVGAGGVLEHRAEDFVQRRHGWLELRTFEESTELARSEGFEGRGLAVGTGGHTEWQEGGESRVGHEQWSADFGVEKCEGEGVGAQAANRRDVHAVAFRSQAQGGLNLVQTKRLTNLQHRSPPKIVAQFGVCTAPNFTPYSLHVFGLAPERKGRRRTFRPETSHGNLVVHAHYSID